ncbi:protein kinase [Nocardia mangyaensis]|uniref:Protein kinase n=1 Tax=Nocardia mangyaensis TaxID=2213200 RepID=A0A1J0VUU5_9NOCA|nr:DUF6764 family protein [Nocardia mangyaensis]APE35832.1 protein kinase [Nocardia mangyaensis]
MNSHQYGRVAGAGVGAALVAGVIAMAPSAAATPVECRVPGAGTIQNSSDTSECAASSVGGSAAAAFGIDGSAAASAGSQGLALAIAIGGGTATSQAQDLSGPAAIAVGPGSTVEASGVRPGLAIGIAGAGATVTLDGRTGPTCVGGPALAGDFQTLNGCVSLG